MISKVMEFFHEKVFIAGRIEMYILNVHDMKLVNIYNRHTCLHLYVISIKKNRNDKISTEYVHRYL